MRAAVLFGPGDMRIVDKPVPKPGAGEVLVRVAMCGMCGTDLKIYDGHFPLTPPFGEFTPGIVARIVLFAQTLFGLPH